ncbi:MAG: heavy metal translocating P-type ATPase, partial [Pseudomonadota bacterium]
MRDEAVLSAPGAGCCPAGAALDAAGVGAAGEGAGRWVRADGPGRASLDLMVPTIRCAGCLSAIERGLGTAPGVLSARVNLTLRRVSVAFDPARTGPEAIVEALAGLGHEARPFDAAAMDEIERDGLGRDLLARLGVAGFAMMNVMLLSVAVWSGAEAATRDLLHWVSGMIALPAIAFAGMPFFRSAAGALRAGRLNMDVPISLAVVLAAGVSLYETSAGGEHAYFDAGISLVFFLLIGRYLDHRTRAQARSAAAELTALSVRSATRILPGGARAVVAAEALVPGDRVAVAPGERVPADGVVEAGASDLDRSMVTGESVPEPVAAGAEIHAGMLNLSGPLELRVTAAGDATLLAEIARMVEAAERGRTRYDRWADIAARQYAWSVHALAALAFGGWLWWTDGDLYRAVTIAAAVLIITCPCALGLAVPAVHAVASGRLFRRGIFLKDGAALERLSAVDMVVFDKTGTLSLGEPRLAGCGAVGGAVGGAGDDGADPAAWAAAAALAGASRHPLARALAAEAAVRGVHPARAEGLIELPGAGVEGRIGEARARLGRPDWVVGETGCETAGAGAGEETTVLLRVGAGAPVRFTFEDRLRADAAETVA